MVAADPETVQPDASRPGSGGRRLAWLDALRAIAALLVVYEHLTHFLFTRYRLAIEHWFLAGYAGVNLFFLVSGYIIPASLERRGSLRGFWIIRIFRLYPLYLVILAVLIALDAVGLRLFTLDGQTAHPGATLLAHTTMLPALLGLPDINGVTWTLAFEMVFYFLVAGLFALGARRAGPLVALVLVGTELAWGTTVPALALSHRLGIRNLVLLATLVFVVSVAAMLSGRRALALGGAVVGMAFAGALLLFNENAGHTGDGLLILAVMFTGTTIYRLERRQLRRRWLVVPLLVGLLWLATIFRELNSLGPFYQSLKLRDLITFGVVVGLFAAGMAARRWRIPPALTWLGVASYSVYLLHLPLIWLLRPLFGPANSPSTARWWVQLTIGAVILGIILLASGITYRLIEAPMHRLGHRLARWADNRYGPDHAPARASAVPLEPQLTESVL